MSERRQAIVGIILGSLIGVPTVLIMNGGALLGGTPRSPTSAAAEVTGTIARVDDAGLVAAVPSMTPGPGADGAPQTAVGSVGPVSDAERARCA